MAFVLDSNKRLEVILAQMKTVSNLDELYELSDEANNILYSAIEKAPCEVNAIRVRTDLFFEQEHLKKFGHFFQGRLPLQRFLEAVLDKKVEAKKEEFEFVRNLPFSFTTGTHGSKEREATGASNLCLAFEVDRGQEFPFAYLKVDNGRGSHMADNVFAAEIKSIALENVNNEDYTKIVGPRRGREIELRDTITAETNYLNFRLFGRYHIGSDAAAGLKFRDEVIKIARSLTVPDDFTELLTIAREGRKARSFSGFAADISTHGPTLYEFTDVYIPKALQEYQFGQGSLVCAYAIFQMQNGVSKFKDNIKEYRGEEVIRKLAGIEIKHKYM